MNREQRNNLINTCLQEIRRLQEENQQLKEQLQQKEDIINKAIEELYIWGEVLNPEFQKRMLEILDNKGEDKNE